MKTTALCLAAACLLSTTANTALFDRGGGLIYDSDLNITWLQDANYANTQYLQSGGAEGYSEGHMDWYQATTWAANLNYYDSVRNVTYTDWRLPTTKPLNGSTFNYSLNTNSYYDGSTDTAYNVSAPGTAYAGSTANEMAHLFYNGIGIKGYCLPSSVAPNCIVSPDLFWQWHYWQSNTAPFTNLQLGYYWSGTEDPDYPTGYPPGIINVARAFDFGEGFSNSIDTVFRQYALAVRPGDVATVPVPAAAWLLGSGLLALVGFARKSKSSD